MKLKKVKKVWLADYESRTWDDVVLPVKVQGRGEYITVYFFADELIQRRASVEQIRGCYKVDAYWKKKDSVVFLQVIAMSQAFRKEKGYFMRWDLKGGVPMLFLTAVVEAELIYRKEFEEVMSEFDRMGIFRPSVQKRISDKSMRIDELPSSGLVKPRIVS